MTLDTVHGTEMKQHEADLVLLGKGMLMAIVIGLGTGDFAESARV